MRATKPNPALEPIDKSRRQRRVGALFALATAPSRSDDEISEAAEMIAILATALEQIADTSTDENARTTAMLAMTELHGR
jgi:hypothetical protein